MKFERGESKRSVEASKKARKIEIGKTYEFSIESINITFSYFLFFRSKPKNNLFKTKSMQNKLNNMKP